jgi:hypothetical protein
MPKSDSAVMRKLDSGVLIEAVNLRAVAGSTRAEASPVRGFCDGASLRAE